MKNKRLFIILISLLLLLFTAAIAMQFTDEVNWTIFDFVVMGIILLSTGLLCEVVMKKATKTKYRIVFCVTIIMVFLLFWAELEVGIFGIPLSG